MKNELAGLGMDPYDFRALSEREVLVLYYRFVLGMTLEETGARFKVHHNRIRDIQTVAMMKIRQARKREDTEFERMAEAIVEAMLEGTGDMRDRLSNGQAQYRCKWCDRIHSLEGRPRTWKEINHFFASQDIYDVQIFRQGWNWMMRIGNRTHAVGSYNGKASRNISSMTFGDWLQDYRWFKDNIQRETNAEDAIADWGNRRFNNPHDEENYVGDPVNPS